MNRTLSNQSLSVRSARWVVALFLALSALSFGKTAAAQEIQLTGPLAGKPAVEHLRQYRKGRFEIAPNVNFTLLDEYRRTILVGARLQYNITDWLGIGVWGAGGVIGTTTDLTDQIAATSPRNDLTRINLSGSKPNKADGFSDQVAKMQWVANPQVQLVPFRGKIAIFQKLFLDADAYFHLGVAFVGLSERADCAIGKCGGDPTKAVVFPMNSRVAIAPTFGLGLNFYANNFMSVGFEYRAMPFAWNRGGFDTRGYGENGKSPDQKVDSSDQTFKFNQMMGISLGFSFPKLSVTNASD